MSHAGRPIGRYPERNLDEATRGAVRTIWMGVRITMEYLADRWADEAEYEDLNDYAARLRTELATLAPDATFVAIQRNPFGFRFKYGAHEFVISCAERYSITQVTA